MTEESSPEEWSWQFDPLDESARVQITLNGVTVAEVQGLKSAQSITTRLRSHGELLAALRKIANYEAEPIWNDDRDDAANEMVRIAQVAIGERKEDE